MKALKVTGFVLAGGRSSRMGQDKALLDWHGRPLVDHMMALLATAATDVQVVGRDRLPDRWPGRGPLSGIATALEITLTDANLIVAVDLPFLTTGFLNYLRSRLEGTNRPLLASKIESHFPLCLGVRRELLPEVQRRVENGNLSVHALIEEADSEILSEEELRHAGFEPPIFRNINTPEDYEGNSGTDV
jgi:molybdopterin-guanine dinucleotide biosynthesis protein A